LEENERNESNGLDRRTFLRRAALTGAAAAWAAPVIQTVAARPAWAAGTPVDCKHSIGAWFTGGVQQAPDDAADGGCMQACKNATGSVSLVNDNSDPCAQVCDAACPNVPNSDDRTCLDGSFCESDNFTVENFGGGDRKVCYTGGFIGGDVTTDPFCKQNF
jgi:hypothetical protein